MSLQNRSGNRIMEYLTSGLEDGQARCLQSRTRSESEITNGIVITGFRDKRHKVKRKPIVIISNISPNEFSIQRGRNKPNCVHFYANNMGNVDRVDQALLEVLSTRGFRSWKRKMIHYFFILAAQNAWRWSQSFTAIPVPFRHFMHRLAWGLIGEAKKQDIIAAIILARSVPIKICKIEHTGVKRICSQCRNSKTPYRCGCLEKHVHPGCWNAWHNAQQNTVLETFIPQRRPGISDTVLRRFWNWIISLHMVFKFILLVIAVLQK